MKGYLIKKIDGKWVVYIGEYRISFNDLNEAIAYGYQLTFN